MYDYAISAVNYRTIGTTSHIDQLWVSPFTDDHTIGHGMTFTKNQIITNIISGRRFVTIWKGQDGTLNMGEEVKVVSVNRSAYLRTDRNEIEEDNLGELPEF